MHMVTTPGVEQHTFALDSTIPALKRVCVARTRACSASRSSGDMATSPLSAVEDAGAVSAEMYASHCAWRCTACTKAARLALLLASSLKWSDVAYRVPREFPMVHWRWAHQVAP